VVPRSIRVVLSRISSLQDHSDTPASILPPLPISSGLFGNTTSGVSRERRGFRITSSSSFVACNRLYSGFSIGTSTLYFPMDIGLHPAKTGSARIPLFTGLSQNRTLPVITVLQLLRSFRRSVLTDLQPATLAGIPDWVGLPSLKLSAYCLCASASNNRSGCLLDTVSGQVRAKCYHSTPPSA
jgi:hypothetical protein